MKLILISAIIFTVCFHNVVLSKLEGILNKRQVEANVNEPDEKIVCAKKCILQCATIDDIDYGNKRSCMDNVCKLINVVITDNFNYKLFIVHVHARV